MSESMSASPKTSIYWIYHWGARTICNHSKQLVGEEALPAHWQVGTSCPGPDDFRPAGLRPRPCHSSASAIECGPLIEHLEISKIYFPQHPHIILTVWDAVHSDWFSLGFQKASGIRDIPRHGIMAFQCCSRSNFTRPGLDSPAPGLKCHRLPRYQPGGKKIVHHGHLPQVFVDKAQTNRQSKQKPQQPSMDDLGIAWNYDSNWVVTCCNMLTAPILIWRCHKVQSH